MITVYCIAKTFAGRLGLGERTYKTKMSFEEQEIVKFPSKCFAKLIHKALYGEELADEDIDDPDEWPTLQIVKENAEIINRGQGFKANCAGEEWCAGCGLTKEIALEEFNLADGQ